jgi:hypothetical protein
MRLGLADAAVTAMLAGAAVAGALSDVAGRYQGRIGWLAGLLVLVELAALWRGCQAAARVRMSR